MQRGKPQRDGCLEAPVPPDASKQPHLGDVALRPGQAYRQRTVHRFSVPALVLVAAASLTACGEGEVEPPTVWVDGGSEQALSLQPQQVRARPGDVVVVHNGNEGLVPDDSTEPDEYAGNVIHLFSSADPGDTPAVFVPAGGGYIPNPTLWGLCRGGTVTHETTSCPELPVEGPREWDGEDYWSLGAMLQGEEREVPLTETIEEGTYRLACALHPGLAVDIVVGEEAEEERVGPPPEPPPLDEVEVDVEAGEVLVGVVVEDAAYNVFVPQSVTVAVGDNVTWRATGPDPHDLNFGDRHFDLLDAPPDEAVGDGSPGDFDGSAPMRSGYMTTDSPSPGGETFAVTFTEPGTYRYQCRFHEPMSGTVVVE